MGVQMMRDITVMVTASGAPGAPGIIKSLRLNGERKIRIVATDMNPIPMDCSLQKKVMLFHLEHQMNISLRCLRLQRMKILM